MIAKVEMYTVECDNCKKTSGDDSDFSCWGDKAYALEDAIESNWKEHEGKHYCPDCYEIYEDENVIITEKKNDNNSEEKTNED